MKLVSWNVNGLRAVLGKGFKEAIYALHADVVCVQETKMQPSQMTHTLDDGCYQLFWNSAERRGYSGTATATRICPLNVECGQFDNEGRVLTLDLGEFYLINVYSPNSQAELARLPYRLEWEAKFRRYVLEHDAVKPVVICGDLNVAHKEIDLANPARNRNSAGFSDQEREAFGLLLDDCDLVDTFRLLHPHASEAYTWWSYFGRARERNVGWRIDYFLVSRRIADRVKSATIHPGIMGSDHCPVSIVLQ
ncbi:MAG: exodeoxyribonuclease III [Muribaculaceae bacterium]|nr:exodeoxyribonuclease III [Muribaculaceae bacterium]